MAAVITLVEINFGRTMKSAYRQNVIVGIQGVVGIFL
jgi:hypothetical protein